MAAIVQARQLYFELEQGSGGSVLGRLGEVGAQKVLADRAAAEADGTVRANTRKLLPAAARGRAGRRAALRTS